MMTPLIMVFVISVLVITVFASPTAAQETAQEDETHEDTGSDESDDALLQEGAAVYSQFCSACHQPGGTGIEGSFPPLIDNPNIDEPGEADYIRDVISNGLEGEITVLDSTYNGVMPSFSTVSDEDVDAVVFYIQSGFQAPSGPAAIIAPTGPVAGSELPGLADLGWIAAYLIAALVALLVVSPRLVSQNDRLETPWFDVWLKTGTIFIAVALAIAFIPNWVLQNSAVTGLARPVQDVIGVSVWGIGLALCLGGLWYAHKDSRI
jgi:mono/diheme cytochrome c family protein